MQIQIDSSTTARAYAHEDLSSGMVVVLASLPAPANEEEAQVHEGFKLAIRTSTGWLLAADNKDEERLAPTSRDNLTFVHGYLARIDKIQVTIL